MLISHSRSRPAMVVFVDHADCPWLRLLKRGFRHCFVALEHPSGWLVCDSLKSHMELMFVEMPGMPDLARSYADQGHHVLVGRTERSAPSAAAPITPITCVNVAKRVLAVRADRVWTPWQLFGHLLRKRSQRWRVVSAHRPIPDCPTRAMIEA